MTEEEADRLTADVAFAVAKCLGLHPDDQAATRWALDLLNLIAGNHVTGKSEWPAAMEFFGLGMLAGRKHPGPVWHGPYTPPGQVESAGELMNVLAELAGVLGPDVPMPTNLYRVNRYGDGRVFMDQVPNVITFGEAINLGVWLIALADPQMTMTAPMLGKVLSK